MKAKFNKHIFEWYARDQVEGSYTLVTIQQYPTKPFVNVKHWHHEVVKEFKEDHEQIQKELGIEFDIVKR